MGYPIFQRRPQYTPITTTHMYLLIETRHKIHGIYIGLCKLKSSVQNWHFKNTLDILMHIWSFCRNASELCHCGYKEAEHDQNMGSRIASTGKYSINNNTIPSHTNAFGEMEFVGFSQNISKVSSYGSWLEFIYLRGAQRLASCNNTWW